MYQEGLWGEGVKEWPFTSYLYIYAMLITRTYNKDVATDMSTPTCVGCIAGVVPTVAPLHRGDDEDAVYHCDSVTTSDR